MRQGNTTAPWRYDHRPVLARFMIPAMNMIPDDINHYLLIDPAVLGEEVPLGKLLVAMTGIIVGYTGSSRGLLLLEAGTEREIGHLMCSIKEKALVLSCQPAGALPETYPLCVVQQVRETGKTAILHNPAEEGDFTADPYILSARPKSILCIPLMQKGRLLAILYLESRAFADNIPALVWFIARQMALSIENELLRRNLEHTVREHAKENRKYRKQEAIHLEEARLATMRETIAAVAHQWRQPLSTVNAIIQNLKDAYSYGELDESVLDRSVNQAMMQIQIMSHTIDTFSGLLQPVKESGKNHQRKKYRRHPLGREPVQRRRIHHYRTLTWKEPVKGGNGPWPLRAKRIINTLN